MILAILSQVPADPAYRITIGGWIIMLLSVGFVTGLLAWCISRVLRESSAKKVAAPLDIQPPDVKQQ
jgi:hypothetical protein